MAKIKSISRTGEITLSYAWSSVWFIKNPVIYTWTDEAGSHLVQVPASYVTDGASVPRVFWSLVGHPLGKRTLPAAILHDFCFSGHPTLSDGTPITFEYAADLYLAMMKKDGVSLLRRTAHWLAVRSPFARVVWNRYSHVH